LRWEIYYGDGTTYDGSPATAPTRDVQVIVMEDEGVAWITQSGSDFYCWRDGRWWGMDYVGYIDYMMSDGWKKVLFGRLILKQEFQAIFRRIKAKWGPKQGYLSQERKP
jgi:hypothetical protein